MSKKYNIKSVGVSEEYKRRVRKRILYWRDEVDPPKSWGALGKLFHMGSPQVQRIYEEEKRDQEQAEMGKG